jgi:putative Mg2+ transporter-C (MgtC) family protein
MFGMIGLSDTEATIRILVALGVGAVIGLEREWRQKDAGFRTYALVCEGSALFMITGLLLHNQVRDAGGVGADPSRIASTVVQGIGFIAGGLIFAAGSRVYGLTTAAGIWVTAALGLLIGAGFFYVAIVGAVATFITLGLFGYIDRYIRHSPRYLQSQSEGKTVESDQSESS